MSWNDISYKKDYNWDGMVVEPRWDVIKRVVSIYTNKARLRLACYIIGHNKITLPVAHHQLSRCSRCDKFFNG